MAQTKATKKFEKNHLKDTIKRRKEFAKIKQKQQIKAKRKERNAKDNERADDVEPQAGSNKPGKDDTNENPFGDMNVDDFFQGGFDIPEKPKTKQSKTKTRGITTTTGKRKRTEPTEDDTSSNESVEQNPVVDESDPEADSQDGVEEHKEQLAALASKDPEFYKYLRENDAELLDFAEDADLAEITLSASEDEETPRKKQKKSKQATKAQAESDESDREDGNELTKAMTKKWGSATAESYSLRAMKEVVLAFRAAAHLNEDNGKNYKYSVSDSDGWSYLALPYGQVFANKSSIS
jgi:nucleolar complex protein 2